MSLSCSLCKLLGDHLSSSELFWMLTNEAYKESVTLVHIVQDWMFEVWWQLSLSGSCLTFQDLIDAHPQAQLILVGTFWFIFQTEGQPIQLLLSGVQPTQSRASGQADLPSAPVDLWIVFYQPCIPEDDGHSEDTYDMEGGSF